MKINKLKFFCIFISSISIMQNMNGFKDKHIYNDFNLKTKLSKPYNEQVNLTSVNVKIQNGKNANYSYIITYDKYITQAEGKIIESKNNQYKTDNINNQYINNKTDSIITNSGQAIGGIPLDKIQDLAVQMPSASKFMGSKIKLNAVPTKIYKNYMIKPGTFYLSIESSGTVNNPSIYIFQNYVDVNTNKVVHNDIGFFLLSPKKSNYPKKPEKQLDGGQIFGIIVGSLIVVTIIISIVSLILYRSTIWLFNIVNAHSKFEMSF